jgi:dolichol kinase
MKKTAPTIEKIVDKFEETKNKINAIEFDAHWYRRVFHAFGACFLFYYLLPTNIDWINLLKFWVPFLILVSLVILEFLRIKGKVSSSHFFGLRLYEKNRVGSYLFFGVAMVTLLLYFPQQIAIPCILCASIGDPVIGEIRSRFGGKSVYVVGFFVCMIFFMVAWYKADFWVMFFVSVVGALGAVIGEAKKFWWIDDDFMIQMVPAVLLLIIWFSAQIGGFEFPDLTNPINNIIYPVNLPW